MIKRKAIQLALLLTGLVASSGATTKANSDVRIYTLDGGHAVMGKVSLLEDETKNKEGKIQLADPCFLIKHGNQWLLWDTGLPDALVGKPQNSPVVSTAKDRTMTDQLAGLGLKPKDINYLAISHFHFDHTGTANLFKDSTWLIQRKELKNALSKPTPFGIDPSLISTYKIAKKKMLNGDYDVFGDGTVKILSTPGHTPGHTSLLVYLKNSGPVFLSGDLFHSRVNYQTSWVPSINSGPSQTRASMQRLNQILKQTHARLIIQHDPGDFASLPKPPKSLN